MKTLSLVVSALMSLLGVMAHASQPGSASAPESIVQSKSFDLGCPTLSWEPVDGARSYELVVYSLGDPNSVSLGDSEPCASRDGRWWAHFVDTGASAFPQLWDLCLVGAGPFRRRRDELVGACEVPGDTGLKSSGTR